MHGTLIESRATNQWRNRGRRKRGGIWMECQTRNGIISSKTKQTFLPWTACQKHAQTKYQTAPKKQQQQTDGSSGRAIPISAVKAVAACQLHMLWFSSHFLWHGTGKQHCCAINRKYTGNCAHSLSFTCWCFSRQHYANKQKILPFFVAVPMSLFTVCYACLILAVVVVDSC